MLVLALRHARTPSTIGVSDEIHNEMAPPVQFLRRACLPLLAKMGAQVDVRQERYGFYPAGARTISAWIEPCAGLKPIELLTRSARRLYGGLPRRDSGECRAA